MTAATIAAFIAATGVLAFSIVAKLDDWKATTSMWPITGTARRLAGPAPVTVTEGIAVAVAVAPLPTVARLLTVGGFFVAYAAIALALRGRRCTCFGGSLPTTFNIRHASLCGLLALGTLTGLAADDPGRTALSGLAAVGAVGGTVAAVVLQRRHARQRSAVALPDDPRSVARILVLGDTHCPVCTLLWDQRTQLVALAACDVELRYARDDADRATAGGHFPAALAYDHDGTVIAGPIWGPTDIHRLLKATTKPETPTPTPTPRTPQ